MKQQKSENYQAYEAAIDGMRTAQTEFELRRGEVIATQERANRVRLTAKDAEAAAELAKLEWDEAFQGADGVMSPDLKRLRSALRDAKDLVEDYNELVAEADAAVQAAELPALLAVRKMEGRRLSALEHLAADEIEKAFAEIAPRLARASRLIDAARSPGGLAAAEHTPYIDTMDRFIGALRSAVGSAIKVEIELPKDLQRVSIAPLAWKAANNLGDIQKRMKAAAAEASQGAR